MAILHEEQTIQAVRKTMQSLSVKPETDTILVALSGGADSVFLIHVLHLLGYRIVAAHVNYSLRGEGSNADEAFCRRLCARLDIEIEVLSIEKFADGSERSIQTMAREIRYQFFKKIKAAHKADLIATAHHADDSIETFFINLLRGTGLRGLTGIPTRRNAIIRPLASISKGEILKYLKGNNIDFRHDGSNDTDKYLRNNIRHNVIPKFREMRPEFDHVMANNIEKLISSENLISFFADEWIDKHCKREEELFLVDKIKLQSMDQIALTYYILKKFGFNYAISKEVHANLESQAGKTFLSGSNILVIDRDYLMIRKVNKAQSIYETIVIDQSTKVNVGIGSIHFTKSKVNEISESSNHLMIVAANKISSDLVIRIWAHGDRFQPEGMNGKHKKISDLLIDLKYSKFEKERVLVLQHNSEIMWVIGIRKDHRYATKEPIESEEYYAIEWLPK